MRDDNLADKLQIMQTQRQSRNDLTKNSEMASQKRICGEVQRPSEVGSLCFYTTSCCCPEFTILDRTFILDILQKLQAIKN